MPTHALESLARSFAQHHPDDSHSSGQFVAPEQAGNHSAVFLLGLSEVGKPVFVVNNKLKSDLLEIILDVLAVARQHRPKFHIVGIDRILQQPDFDCRRRKRFGWVRVHVLEKTICGTLKR